MESTSDGLSNTPSPSQVPPRTQLEISDLTLYLYCGELPPWDEALGVFRNFTDQEKSAAVVCTPYNPFERFIPPCHD